MRMRGRLLLAVLAAAVICVLAGQEATSASDPVARARAVLLEKRGELGLRADLSDLQPVEVSHGLAGDYVRFQQTIGHVPVHGADVVVGLSEDGDRTAVRSDYRPDAASRRTTAPHLPEHAAVAAAFNALGAGEEALRAPLDAQQVYVPLDGHTELLWHVTLPLAQPLGTWLVAVDSAGDIVYVQDMLRYDDGQVFDPSPPYHSGGTIPPPEDCDDPANEPALSSQYFTRELLGILDGQNKLKGEYVDLTAPGIIGYKPAGQADEPSRVYSYPCTDDRFEEVMAYYHVDSTQRKIQSLGFSGAAAVVNRSLPVHAHFLEFCNAFFDPATEALHFGDGGPCGFDTDTAEDADVIVHEYGHAIQHDQVPGWGFGAWEDAEQAWAMGEGFSDFLTAAMFGDSCLADWFSVGNSCLRNIDNTNTYPTDFEACRPEPDEPVQEHCAGLIWGGALWDLAQALGGDQQAFDLALTLVLESHFLLSPLATFDEAASAIRQADALLFGSTHGLTIDSVFADRGILTDAAVEDFSYAYLRINHQRRGQLDVDLLVGSQASPDCQLALYGPVPGDNVANLVGYAILDETPCEGLLPPSAERPWHLRVRDVTSGVSGVLNRFDISLLGSERCYATDLPIAIPDNDGFVYSTIDCSSSVTGDLSDDDGDGFEAAIELHVGTDPSAPCGGDGWPADLVPDGFSENKLDIQDFGSFAAPIRRLNTDIDSIEGNVRWDLVPGRGAFGADLNLQDMGALIVLYPPMLDGERAFNQHCPG